MTIGEIEAMWGEIEAINGALQKAHQIRQRIRNSVDALDRGSSLAADHYRKLRVLLTKVRPPEPSED